MLIDKQQVLSMISDSSQVEQAGQQLPDMIDHEEHSGLLQQFGIDPGQAAAQAQGGDSGDGAQAS